MNGWGRQRAHMESLVEAVPERRETGQSAVHESGYGVQERGPKTVTYKRGFESCRKLCKEYGSMTGTSLHEYSNLLECDFGTRMDSRRIAEVGEPDC